MTKIAELIETDRSAIISDVQDALLSQARSEVTSEKVEQITEQSDALANRFGRTITVIADTTDELKALQETVGIEEEQVRELQQEDDISRLAASRRADYIEDLLNQRVEQHADNTVGTDPGKFRDEAEALVDDLFNASGDRVEKGWKRKKSGRAVSGPSSWVPTEEAEKDDEYSDIVAQIDNGIISPDIGDLSKPRLKILVPSGGATLTVDGDIGDETRDLSPGAYKVRPRSIRDHVIEAGLAEVEQRDASCSSSDKEALDIEVGRGESETLPYIIELQSGDAGYSSRHTKGWTEYRDYDPDTSMALVTVGQASYYNGGMRGKQERTWLIGHDDGQGWSQQVYNTHETVGQALEFITPAEVQRLRDEGREVIRQGDIFFVEMKRASNFEDIEGTRHEVEEVDDGVVVRHPEHTDLQLEGEWKALQNIDGSNPGGGRSRSSRRNARD